MQESKGIYLSLRYIAPRKRKYKPFGVCGDSIPHALEKAREWLANNKGKYIKGALCGCTFHDTTLPNSEVIRMHSVPILAPAMSLTDEQLEYINN